MATSTDDEQRRDPTLPPETSASHSAPRRPDLPLQVARVRAEAALFGGAIGAANGRLESPARIGRFLALRVVGEGGMGRVYAAYDEQLDRRVAIKVLHPLRAGIDPGLQARVLREAKAMAKLGHPNVVQVFEVGEHDDQLFVAMEFVRGSTLDAWQRAEGRSWRQVLAAYVQAGEGLAAAHAAGLIHRDFKPQNAIVETLDDGVRVRVLDFGLARLRTDVELGEQSIHGDGPSAAPEERLTATGRLLGTPAYMAPEQFESAAVDEAADQFSFCIALWEALYLQRPFEGATWPSLLDAMMQGRLRPPPRDAPVPGWLRPVLQRGLAVAPDHRWPSMRALLQALGRDPAIARRKWVAATAGLAVVAVAAVVGQTWIEARAQRCSGAQQALGGAWDEAQRGRVEAAMSSSRVPYAERAWQRAASELDAYAAAWTAMHEEACAATTVRGEQSAEVMDVRMACLNRARVQLVAVTETLATADDEVMANAHQVTDELRDLQRCEDVEALRAELEPPATRDAAAVDEARALLARSKAEHQAGRYGLARQALNQAGITLDGVDYSPVRIELALHEGEVLGALGELAAAEQALTRALDLATVRLDGEAMCSAASHLLFVVGYQQSRPDEALLRFRELADRLARGKPLVEADVARSLAAVFHQQGEYEAAEAQTRRALELQEASLGADDLAIAVSLSNLAGALETRGDHEQAVSVYRRGLAIEEAALGPDHPSVAISLSGLASAHFSLGEAEEATAVGLRALAIQEQALGPAHPDLATTLNNLANAHEQQGDHEAAESFHQRALAIAEQALGPDHPDVARSLSGLGNLAYRRRAYEEAESFYKRALSIWERTLGPEHPAIVAGLSNLASVYQSQGQYAEAQPLNERALAINERVFGPDHPAVALTLGNIATGYHQRGDYEAAKPLFERALAIREKALGSDHSDVAMSLAQLGELELDLGRPAAALPLLERSARIVDAVAGEPEFEARVHFDLAQALWLLGRDRARAIEHARRARDAMVEAGPARAKDLAEVEAWLARAK